MGNNGSSVFDQYIKITFTAHYLNQITSQLKSDLPELPRKIRYWQS